MDRSDLSTVQSVRHLWNYLGLPERALDSLKLTGEGPGVPSSFKIGHIAQASIALSALTAALVYAELNNVVVPQTGVDLQDALVEFKSERLLTINDAKVPSLNAIGGLHKTSDGHIRIHDAFVNQREGAKTLLKCQGEDDRAKIAEATSKWTAIHLETIGTDAGLSLAVLRSYQEWDALPQAQAVANFPITIRKIRDAPPGLPATLQQGADKCLRGLRVLEMTRVIAGPVAGKTLAAHGADVLWVTSPDLPDLPAVDRDVGRGKRSVFLNINELDSRRKLDELLAEADVFLQSYRPGSLASKGLTPEALASKSKHCIIYATLSAYGPEGPWKDRRGFDSIVQTCTGLNVSEAHHYGAGEASRVLPCQVLDHASGYFLAAGIAAALHKQATEGGSFEVQVSLAGTMKYLRSLGQYEGASGFECPDFNTQDEVPVRCLEERDCEFGKIKAVKHSAQVEGLAVSWDIMPRSLGSDKAQWLSGRMNSMLRDNIKTRLGL